MQKALNSVGLKMKKFSTSRCTEIQDEGFTSQGSQRLAVFLSLPRKLQRPAARKRALHPFKTSCIKTRSSQSASRK